MTKKIVLFNIIKKFSFYINYKVFVTDFSLQNQYLDTSTRYI
jgi:hypothetical protein